VVRGSDVSAFQVQIRSAQVGEPESEDGIERDGTGGELALRRLVVAWARSPASQQGPDASRTLLRRAPKGRFTSAASVPCQRSTTIRVLWLVWTGRLDRESRHLLDALSMAKLQSPLVATKSPRPSGDAQRYFLVLLPPLARASLMRNDSPSVTTTTLWCNRRSSRITAVVCSGRKRPHSSKGQCEAIPSARAS
jgi:hypothetical protein